MINNSQSFVKNKVHAVICDKDQIKVFFRNNKILFPSKMVLNEFFLSKTLFNLKVISQYA